MDLTGQKTPLTDFSLNDLHQLGRDEIAELVTAGLLEADRAAEIQSEDFQHNQDEQQLNAVQHLQAQQKIDEQKQDADWLQHMSQSYQQAYHQLMDAYGNAESQYGEIKTRAEKLKERLREKAETAYQFGVPLPDGRLAFYDRKNNDFVDGATLQPLQGDDAKTAAQEFQQLSPKQQKANACYVDACNAYADANGISQAADEGSLNVKNAKTVLQDSQGSISEAELNKMGTNVKTQADGLSDHLTKAESADATLDAALSADADDAVTPQNAASQTKPISFASQIDTNAKPIGDGNGKTSTTFNTSARPVTIADAAVANVPVTPATRLPVVAAP